ncbi:class I SAM-dependent methyltransferase [Hoyosella sp. G463]|uniref:Class I SAM-dependent methyltransferase n=1 Tax=Lolliginicoccus lacisalsi TaxID=2742202 RepID=A0A927PKT5_9ACTN|nr:class I SAM-dependent methyltransferase [Lolliginicoccus lacisalsi]MBD8505129.1 class I SAM-dependent methyltransferase [Lolliginicoccus lacisalsi]
MGFYGDTILPRIINVACGTALTKPQREQACAGLTGEVVEIGFGSGLNIPFYPPSVSRVMAIEPADTAWHIARKRVEQSSVPVERHGLDGQSLPLDDASCDSALSTWTLCTIPDVTAALHEVRRVLKPGGTFHFVEHGLAPDAKVQAWQHRLNPLQQKLFGGCNLDRPIAQLIEDAGFTISTIDEFYEKGSPKFLGALSLGVATRA